MQDLILPRIAVGDQSAVPECISRYGSLIWTLVRRRLANRQDVEDVVQEVFIDLWRSADRFDPQVAEEITFVAMITRRRVIDRIRRSTAKQAAVSLDEAMATDVADPTDGAAVGQRLEFGEEAQLADEHLSQLKPEEQQVLRLSIYDSLSHSVIAKQTGLPLGTVKSHIRRGLDSLRKKLAGRNRANSNSGQGRTTAERSSS